MVTVVTAVTAAKFSLPLLPVWARGPGGWALRCLCCPRIHRPSARPSPEVQKGATPGAEAALVEVEGPSLPRLPPPAGSIAEVPTVALLLLLPGQVGGSQGINKINKTTAAGMRSPLRFIRHHIQWKGRLLPVGSGRTKGQFRRPSNRRRRLLWQGNLLAMS